MTVHQHIRLAQRTVVEFCDCQLLLLFDALVFQFTVRLFMQLAETHHASLKPQRRSSPRWCSCCSMTAHTVFDLHSPLTKAVRLFIASLHSSKLSYQTCFIDIFVDLQPVRCNAKWGLFESGFGELWRLMGRGRPIG